jgi:hypothetical protein
MRRIQESLKKINCSDICERQLDGFWNDRDTGLEIGSPMA